MRDCEDWRPLCLLDVVVEASNLGGLRKNGESLTQSNEAYRRVWLAGKYYAVHRLIAEAFCQHTKLSDSHRYVDHIDRNTHNNSAANLRFATCAENNANRSKGTKRRRGQEAVAADEMWETLLCETGEIVTVSSRGRVYTGLRDQRSHATFGRAGEQGYLRCGKSLYVHRVVASAFIENSDPTSKRYVNHRDGNRHNNQVENLEWLSASDNVADAWKRRRLCVETAIQVL